MKNAADLFPTDAQERVNDAVRAAEKLTSVEIVPVAATASGRYDRAEDIAGLWLGILALTAGWLLFQGVETDLAWGETKLSFGLPAAIAAVVAGFMAGAFVTSRVGWLRRLFTPKAQMRDETLARARTVFFDGRVHHTGAGTGLLLYISMFERMAVVLGDRQVEEKLGPETLAVLCEDLTARLKDNLPPAALCAFIESVAEKLRTALPVTREDANELPDALILLDAP